MKYILAIDRFSGDVFCRKIELKKPRKNAKHPITDEEYIAWESAHYCYDVLKTTEVVKDLCDEYVVAYEDGARIVYSDLDWAKTKARASLEFGHKSVIYGAVWTSKGLIYIAKSNENGELELI